MILKSLGYFDLLPMAATWNDGTMESVSEGHHFPIWIKVDTAVYISYKPFFQDLKRSTPLKTQKNPQRLQNGTV
jgi:hypothetical protein